jgi:geranylgeranylglycerol-phosphate geranylgeranyltransferase
VWVGAIVAGNVVFTPRILLASISASFVAACGNTVNDLFDMRVDAINKPNRPLVRGVVRKPEAIAAAILFGWSGLILSLPINLYAFSVTFCVLILLLLYTPILKSVPFLGNVLVAFVASLAFVYGGIAVGRPFGALILSGFAFLMHLSREMVKDIEDRLADIQAGIRTAATLNNARPARLTAIAVLAILIIATFLPVATGLYGAGYFIVVLIGTDFFLVESAHQLAWTKDEADMHRIAMWLKIAMPFGLLAVLLGHWGL